MILSDISVKRPVFAMVVSLLLIAFGTLSFLHLPLRELPNIDPPVVSVQTAYRGASAAIVDTRVTDVIEDAISGIDGIETIDSSSQDGRSDVSIEFALDRDIDGAANDVRDAVARAVDNLPQDIDAPEISKVEADSNAIIWYSLSSDRLSGVQIADYADRVIVDRLSVVSGVARVYRSGGRYAMRIWLDRDALAARQLTVSDIEAALARENVELPAGQIESKNRDMTVRVARSYGTPDDFARLPLKEGADGHIIRLGEVAQVELGSDVDHSYFQGNGHPHVGIGIVKQSTANTLSVAQAVDKEVDRLRKSLPPGMVIRDAFDTSLYIDAAVHDVYFTLALALLLVIGVIYLFLGRVRTALIPAVTVPVCIIGSFIALDVLHLSINLLTLLALVLSIGLVVDDAIVVLENIQRRVDLGEAPLVAAYRGARQVGFAVIATTTVLISVFVPIMFLQGDVGRLFTELAIAVSAAVGFSALVALTLTPMMCSKLLTPSQARTGLAHRIDAFFTRVRTTYIEALGLCLARPRSVLIVLGASLVAVVALWQLIPTELAPQEDRGYFYTQVVGPQGAGFDYTVRQVRAVEKVFTPYRESGEVKFLLSRVPASFNTTTDMSAGAAIAMLAPWSDRHRSANALMRELAPKLGSIPGAKVFTIAPPPLGRGRSVPVQFVIGGTDYAELARWRDLMLDRMNANPRLLAVDSDYQETKPQLKVDIDRTRAADLGVSVESIGHTLETMLGSRKETTYLDRGKEYDVILRVRAEERMRPGDLTNIYVRSERTGALIPLSNLIKVTEIGGASTLKRFNRLRAVTLSANLAPGYSLGEALGFLEKTARETLPAAAQVDYRGDSRTFKQSGRSLYFTFAMALVVVFLVLSAQFESFVHPFVILLTVPLAVAGGLFGLYMLGSTLNIYSEIGVVILIGLASKNGILIVEFANQLRDAGKPLRDALVEAASIRLRPIIMTSVATAIGALPLVLATGAGAASRFTIGIVIFSGVLFATLLTVFVVPVVYELIARGTTSPEAVARKLAALEGQTERSVSPGE